MSTTRETNILTIAAIRQLKETGITEYLFNERQQIYSMHPMQRASEDIASRLREAMRKKEPVKVTLDPRKGSIQKVNKPSKQEIAGFHVQRELLDKPNKPIRVRVGSIDPTRFNIVDRYLKIPTFRLCNKIVPNYTTARKIFDFCAEQSCHLPGPHNVSPCIPFQYVIDGCYARAHKMRWIITTKYRYCCEKVFSFANQNNDRLAVTADKWGGCCVTWWYHVAPLIRVRVKLGAWDLTLAMVIDPGMFNKPVLLSSWLSAQENVLCSANAHVSMYSIQPGSAYTPANYSGTAFTTDPTYSATNSTLISYSGLTTC